MTLHIAAMLLGVFVAAVSQTVLKKGALRHYETLAGQYLNPYVLGGYALLVLSTVLVIFAYRGMPYKYGPVIETLGFILVMVFSRLFFHEKFNRRKISGACLIILGIIIFYI